MMDIQVEAKLLDDDWHALHEPIHRYFLGNERPRAERMAAALLVDRSDIGNLLKDWDARVRSIDIFALANVVGLPTGVISSLSGRKTHRPIIGHDRTQDGLAPAPGFSVGSKEWSRHRPAGRRRRLERWRLWVWLPKYDGGRQRVKLDRADRGHRLHAPPHNRRHGGE